MTLMQRILVDGDSCSRIETIFQVSKKHGIPVELYCDTSRKFNYSNAATVHYCEIRKNSTDFAIVSAVQAGDIVVTNDTGLASMCLAKHAYAINNFGAVYTQSNIMDFLTVRYIRDLERRKNKRQQIRGSFKPIGTIGHGTFKEELEKLIK